MGNKVCDVFLHCKNDGRSLSFKKSNLRVGSTETIATWDPKGNSRNPCTLISTRIEAYLKLSSTPCFDAGSLARNCQAFDDWATGNAICDFTQIDRVCATRLLAVNA